VIVMSATMARVTTTMVMMRLEVDGIVNVIIASLFLFSLSRPLT
jgi:hypothetical protein